MRFFTRHDGQPIVKTEAFKQSKLANKVHSIVRRESSFDAIVKSVMNFSAAFDKGHGVYYLAAWTVDIVELKVWSYVPFDNSPLLYHCYTSVARFSLQHPTVY